MTRTLPPTAHAPGLVAGDFAHVCHWVFDLDNTLYPPEAQLFAQIEVRMNAWVMQALGVAQAEANRLRRHWWELHGTTLAGLMHDHAIDPEPFLVAVHDIDLAHLAPDPALRDGIAALPGRRIVYTNGSAPYAERVLAARGLSGLFDAVYGVEHAQYRPKPARAAFEAIFAMDGVQPAQGAMFEDDPRNLAVPHALGMQTVLVGPPAETVPACDHIGHRTTDLAGFLAGLRHQP